MKTQRVKPIAAKCWDGAFRRVNLVGESTAHNGNATVIMDGIEYVGTYLILDDKPVFNKL
jgi:hypothetical protein